MRKGRLVTGLVPIKKSVLSTIRRLNECQPITEPSAEWTISIGMSKYLFPPEGMTHIVNEIVLGRTPSQQIVIFESEAEAYVVVCHPDLIEQVRQMAATTDPENILAYVRQMAP
ncbi:MAG: hypothetical protein KC419_16245 [Anaerolineales bacterium]|nr:hypothetical protein [Anaerolineales bacterium]